MYMIVMHGFQSQVPSVQLQAKPVNANMPIRDNGCSVTGRICKIKLLVNGRYSRLSFMHKIVHHVSDIIFIVLTTPLFYCFG